MCLNSVSKQTSKQVCMYVCRLLARFKRTSYTIENKIVKMQMSKRKRTQLYDTKRHATRR